MGFRKLKLFDIGFEPGSKVAIFMNDKRIQRVKYNETLTYNVNGNLLTDANKMLHIMIYSYLVAG